MVISVWFLWLKCLTILIILAMKIHDCPLIKHLLELM